MSPRVVFAPILFYFTIGLSQVHGGFIVGDSRDGDIRANGISVTNGVGLAVGRAGGLPGEPVPVNSAIYFFPLPTLAPGNALVDANLQVTLFEKNNLALHEHADLYALGYVTSLPSENELNDSWYFSGDLDTRTGGDLGTNIGSTPILKVADDFATTSTPLGDVNTDPVADAALTTFINGLYTVHGAEGGDYLAMRISANQLFPETSIDFHRYLFYARDNTDPATWPVLTLTPVPEPSTSVLLFTGGIVLVTHRLRRRRRAIR